MDIHSKTFIVHLVIREREEIPVHFKKQAQIGVLLFDKALIEVLIEYSDYSKIILAENTVKPPENTRRNNDAIELEEGK